MEAKMSVVIVLVVVASALAVTESFPSGGVREYGRGLSAVVGEFMAAEEEMLMESETSRRALAAATRRYYIGYGALRANQVPCGRRGHSYYNCQGRNRANPYKRGCTAITRCARYTG